VGVGGSIGEHHGTPAAPQLPRVATWSGLPYFAFRSDGTATGTAVANGQTRRLVPQASWHAGPLGAYAEYVLTSDEVAGHSLRGEGWSVVASIVPTGEPSVPLHYVIPTHDFDLSKGELGAVELTASVGSLRMDAGPAAIEVSPVAASRLTRAVAGGVNWYPNLGVRVMVDVSHTEFSPYPGLATPPDETVLVARLQVVL
jgi:phosphate-selective porin